MQQSEPCRLIPSEDRIATEYPLRNRSIAVIFDNTKLFPVVDNLKEQFVVFRIVAPPPGLGGPHDAISLNSASIGKNEIVDWPRVGQEKNIAGGSRYLHDFRIAIRNRCHRRPANRSGIEERRSRCRRHRRGQDRECNQPRSDTHRRMSFSPQPLRPTS